MGSWRSLRWKYFHDIVHQLEGPNDGIVSLASAGWGDDHEVWDGDHLSLINWPDPVSRRKRPLARPQTAVRATDLPAGG